MASNGIDVWIPPEVEWDKRRTIAFALLGSLVAFCALKQVFVDNLIVTSIMFLSVLLAVVRTFPSKWFRLLAAFSILAAFIGFELGFVDALIIGDFILLFVLLAVAYTFPDKLYRFLTALSIVMVLSVFFGVSIYDFASKNLAVIKENRLLRLFLEGQVERAIFSGLAGLIGGLFIIGVLLLLFTFPSSEFILALHEFAGVRRWDALRWLWSLIMGIQHPWQIVEDGKVTVTKPKGVFGEIGGPGVVVVRPGNAVVFEWGGEVTKIEGPGIHKTKRFERIKQVVDLRPQWSTVKAENVLTKDRVPLMLEVGVGYHIEPKQDTDRRIEKAESKGKEFEWEFEKGEEVIEGVYPVYKDSVFKAVYLVSGVGWQRIVEGVTDSFLRDVVAAYTLDQLYEPSEAAEGELKESPRIIAEIEDRVQKRLEETAIKFGVKIGAFDITSVEMPEDVRKQVLEWWRAEWQKQVAIVKAEGEAEVTRCIELAKAKARMDMITTITRAFQQIPAQPAPTANHVIALRLIEALEKMATEPGTRDLLPYEVFEALRRMRGMLGEGRALPPSSTPQSS